MNLKYLIGWSSALCLSAMVAQAQETNEVDKLDQRLKQIQESFEKQQREMRESFERLIREQQAQIESLKKQLANIPTNAVAGPKPMRPRCGGDPGAVEGVEYQGGWGG
jgi:septal ring factor EnvC (AmiA/AmiB activator)